MFIHPSLEDVRSRHASHRRRNNGWLRALAEEPAPPRARRAPQTRGQILDHPKKPLRPPRSRPSSGRPVASLGTFDGALLRRPQPLPAPLLTPARPAHSGAGLEQAAPVGREELRMVERVVEQRRELQPESLVRAARPCRTRSSRPRCRVPCRLPFFAFPSLPGRGRAYAV